MNYFGNLPKIQKILDFKCYIQGTSYLIVDLQSGSSLQLEPRVLYWQFNHEMPSVSLSQNKA
ncbi:hypothetical protein KSMBR1_4044 [Candidatus Kuenenia stuttgartiensis]|uniref:Uncharacterized protein n=1 Tax=Kuenenia stuttgartiensis TaxID=174633 RepID=A0A2C9CLH6_KUEST|nr:hypothetical protein KSMBR1_4044 [Candidatus Kuenenia stuttgartiensis]